jgi:hypothetical protein
MKSMKPVDLRGRTPESWVCIDCGINTAPGFATRIQMEQSFTGPRVKEGVTVVFTEQCEVYMVKDATWKAAGMEEDNELWDWSATVVRFRFSRHPKPSNEGYHA